MTNRERFPNLSSELIDIFDAYDKALANGELWIEEGHAISTNNPGQVWVKFASTKVRGISHERN